MRCFKSVLEVPREPACQNVSVSGGAYACKRLDNTTTKARFQKHVYTLGTHSGLADPGTVLGLRRWFHLEPAYTYVYIPIYIHTLVGRCVLLSTQPTMHVVSVIG